MRAGEKTEILTHKKRLLIATDDSRSYVFIQQALQYLNQIEVTFSGRED